MAKHSGELSIPLVAEGDAKGVEILRMWAAQGKQHIIIRTGLWKDPGTWGIALVDLAKLVANAYERDEKLDRHYVLKRIKEGFDAEWGHPTDEPSGS